MLPLVIRFHSVNHFLRHVRTIPLTNLWRRLTRPIPPSGFIGVKHTWALSVSVSTTVMANISVLARLVIWTVLIKREGDVNS